MKIHSLRIYLRGGQVLAVDDLADWTFRLNTDGTIGKLTWTHHPGTPGRWCLQTIALSEIVAIENSVVEATPSPSDGHAF